MVKFEQCHIPVDDHPFIAIAMASFDLLSGIKIYAQWNFCSDINKSSLQKLFKITLSNVHRQKRNNNKDITTSVIELSEVGWYVFNTIFTVDTRSKGVNHSLVFVLKSSDVTYSPHMNEVFEYWAKNVTLSAKRVLTKGESIIMLRPVVMRAAEHCSIVFKAGIKEIPELVLDPKDTIFYSKVLTSHLRTQMTTVIEGDDIPKMNRLAAFLLRYMLPYQRDYSSLSPMKAPLPGLYLQCVEPVASKKPHMIKFDQTVTWVRMYKNSVSQTPPREEQTTAHDTYILETYWESIPMLVDDFRLVRKVNPTYKLQKNISPTALTVAAVNSLMQLPAEARDFVSGSQLDHIVRQATALLVMVDSLLAATNSKFVPSDMIPVLWKSLRLTGKDDLYIVVDIAYLFDPSIYGKVIKNRREALRQVTTFLA